MTEEQPDTTLWELAGSGDGEAFGQLFDRHSRAVYNHCFRLTASWSAAEDLTSTTFPLAWRQRVVVTWPGHAPVTAAVQGPRFLARVPGVRTPDGVEPPDRPDLVVAYDAAGHELGRTN